MATIVLGAVGTLVGGPIGGALGALVGQQLDNAIFKTDPREGPRLDELAVTTSSYGSPVPRIFGTMRTAGTIIWATEIRENAETASGGKGEPATTTYSYTASFAVALASRPIAGVGRIWADGNLLRGANGDLKVGGRLRIHTGAGDQRPDPLLASAIGASCPAHRGLAYAVFEDLQLGDFGSRIPALTFELAAGDEAITVRDLVGSSVDGLGFARPFEELGGIRDSGGGMGALLGALDQVYPMSVDVSGGALAIEAADTVPQPTLQLPPAASLGETDEGFAPHTGTSQRRTVGRSEVPNAIRHYDAERDFQPGVQRAAGHPGNAQPVVVELPANLSAAKARELIGEASRRARRARETIGWRLAELDPAITTGTVVTLPDRRGLWRVTQWDWVSGGVELTLVRVIERAAETSPSQPGNFAPPPDLPLEPTVLQAFELPPAEIPTDARPQVTVGASAAGPGWTGAALYADVASQLQPVGALSRPRAILGSLATALPPSPAMVLERDASAEIDLVAADHVLPAITTAQALAGGNRLRVGGEILHFVSAEHLSATRWRISGLLRGRQGTEAAAQQGASAGADCALLASHLSTPELPPESEVEQLAALGLADQQAVVAQIANRGLWSRPPSPVHGRMGIGADGTIELSWIRRGRGAWAWPLQVEVPLVESSEAYRIGIGPPDTPYLWWDVDRPSLTLSAAEWTAATTDRAGQPVWVRQLGTLAPSLPLLLAIVTQEA